MEGTVKTQGWAHFHSMSYRITFSEPIETVYQYMDGKLRKDSLFLRLNTAEDLKFHYKFSEKAQPLYVKVALSVVDPEGAEKNLEAELPGWDFDKTREESTHIWNEALNLIQIEADPKVMVEFLYGALPYHDRPLRLSRRGRALSGHGQESAYRRTGLRKLFRILPLWDTFRALHPLMTIINPDLATDWGKVLVQGYKEGGILPKWPLASSYTGCMVGYPAVSVLADLVAKDLAEGDMSTWAGSRRTFFRLP